MEHVRGRSAKRLVPCADVVLLSSRNIFLLHEEGKQAGTLPLQYMIYYIQHL